MMTTSATTSARRKLSLPAAPTPPFPHHPGSALSVEHFSLSEITHILHRAHVLERENPLMRANRLARRRLGLLFYEASTRTRTSFELAAKGLGIDTTLVSNLSSSIEKGESLKDTGLTLRAIGVEAIILRHNCSGAPWLLEHFTDLPILNAGDGWNQHPSQAFLDLRTLLAHISPRHFTGEAELTSETLKGFTLTIVGDILHSRVARSNMLLLPRLGAEVILTGPPALLPDVAASMGPGITIERDFVAALRRSQALIMLRVQSERLAGLDLDLNEYKSSYQLTEDLLRTHAPEAHILHPGPIIRGLEITAAVADGPQSRILEQVHNGLPIRMALVERAFAALDALEMPMLFGRQPARGNADASSPTKGNAAESSRETRK